MVVRALVRTLSPRPFGSPTLVTRLGGGCGGPDWLGRPVCGAFGKRPRLVVEPGVEQDRPLDDVATGLAGCGGAPAGQDPGDGGVHHGLVAAELQRQRLDDASSAWPRAGPPSQLLTGRILQEY